MKHRRRKVQAGERELRRESGLVRFFLDFSEQLGAGEQVCQWPGIEFHGGEPQAGHATAGASAVKVQAAIE